LPSSHVLYFQFAQDMHFYFDLLLCSHCYALIFGYVAVIQFRYVQLQAYLYLGE
jgi:hypothetical protein